MVRADGMITAKRPSPGNASNQSNTIRKRFTDGCEPCHSMSFSLLPSCEDRAGSAPTCPLTSRSVCPGPRFGPAEEERQPRVPRGSPAHEAGFARPCPPPTQQSPSVLLPDQEFAPHQQPPSRDAKGVRRRRWTATSRAVRVAPSAAHRHPIENSANEGELPGLEGVFVRLVRNFPLAVARNRSRLYVPSALP